MAGTSLNPIRGSQLRALGKSARTEFMKRYGTYQPAYMDACMTLRNVDKESIRLDWLGSPPSMVEYKDEKKPQGLFEYNFSVDFKDYETTIEVDRRDVQFDATGSIMTRVRDMATVAQNYPGKYIRAMVVAGTAGTYATCYDGQFFFDTDHSEGNSGTQSNDLAGASGSGGPLAADSLSAARAAMFKFKDDQAEVMGIVGDTLIVPPELESTALELVQSPISTVATHGKTNVHQGRYKVWVWSELTSPAWLLACTGGELERKPMIYIPVPHPYNGQDVWFASLGFDSDEAFFRKHYYFTVEKTFGAAYGDWRYMIYNKGAA